MSLVLLVMSDAVENSLYSSLLKEDTFLNRESLRSLPRNAETLLAIKLTATATSMARSAMPII